MKAASGKTRRAKAAPARPVRGPRGQAMPKWVAPFLAELAATSNVMAAARAADIASGTVYALRRTHAEFNRKWQLALCEGYDNLEMELLHRLRTGEIKPAAGAKKGVRTFDNVTAFRQLAAHRESVMRQRGVRDQQDSETIIGAINAKLDRMRARRLGDRKAARAGTAKTGAAKTGPAEMGPPKTGTAKAGTDTTRAEADHAPQ